MPTIYDVAKAAKVSPKTVSRVMNGDGPVREKTRAAVRDAMAALGYVPSSAARTMRSQRSGLVGIVTGALSGAPVDQGHTGLPELLIVQAAQRAFEGTRFTLMIADTGGDPARVPHLLSTFAEHRVEGVIYVADYHRLVDMPVTPPGQRVVLVNCAEREAGGLPAILPDDEAGQAALTGWALERGHRRIAYLTLPEGLRATELRLRGYRRALEAAGLAYDPELVTSGAADDAAPVRRAVEALMTLTEPPTCILCGNDSMAMRLYGVLRSMGLSVPGDVSVAGYDDHRAISEMLYPPLTTAVLPYGAMGARAAEILTSIIEGEPAPTEPLLVGGGVVPRDSVLAVGAAIQRGRET